MTRNALLLGSLIALLASIAGCGGGTRAALNATVFPGDRIVTGRRLENLARTFETEYGCVETDTITITGLAPGVYNVDGCAHMRDYQMQCRPGAYSQICEWIAFEDLGTHASRDFGGCDPSALDIQITSPNTRAVTGCGLRANYMVQCAGSCGWILMGRIEPAGAAVGGGGYTY